MGPQIELKINTGVDRALTDAKEGDWLIATDKLDLVTRLYYVGESSRVMHVPSMHLTTIGALRDRASKVQFVNKIIITAYT
jgi:hypothetical protein